MNKLPSLTDSLFRPDVGIIKCFQILRSLAPGSSTAGDMALDTNAPIAAIVNAYEFSKTLRQSH